MPRFVSWSVRLRPAAALLAGAALVSGCIAGRPECSTLPAEVAVALTAETLTPSNITVCRGTDVVLAVTPAVDGVLHIHGYDEEVPATAVTSGEVLELTFGADRSGQFPIELHTDDNAQGVTVGLFTVDEP